MTRNVELVSLSLVALFGCPAKQASDQPPPSPPATVAIAKDAAAAPSPPPADAPTTLRSGVTITARYLGRSDQVFYDPVDGGYSMSKTKRCERKTVVFARVFFSLEGASPWPANEVSSAQLTRMAMLLPCPELTRAEFQQLVPDAETGGGRAPVLQPGTVYRLEVSPQPHLSEPEDASGVGTEPWRLTTIDPA